MNYYNNQIPNPNIQTINIPQYNPYQPKMDRMMEIQQQNQFNTNQIQQIAQNSSQPFLTVSNLQEAKEKIVQYNTSVWMRDSSEPYLYVKSLDITGTPSFKILKVQDVTNEMLNEKVQNANNVEFVSIDKYNELNEAVSKLQDNVNYYNSLLTQLISTKEEEKESKRKTAKTERVEINE